MKREVFATPEEAAAYVKGFEERDRHSNDCGARADAIGRVVTVKYVEERRRPTIEFSVLGEEALKEKLCQSN